ncbi:MAG: aminotransferase class IV [Bacteroidota bacterium]
MYPFFETIRYQNAVADKLQLHQHRLENTFLHFGRVPVLDLMRIDFKKEAEKNGALRDCVYKTKVSYDLLGNYHISFEPYSIRTINTFTLFDIGSNDYSIKFTDRVWINNALKSVTTDEVIFVKDGFLKDASYANIVLFDGYNWVTPSNPLLLGTYRALLLNEKKIIEKPITIDQLKDHKRLKFINAMMLWDESPIIDLS